jgi:hypothetical protein
MACRRQNNVKLYSRLDPKTCFTQKANLLYCQRVRIPAQAFILLPVDAESTKVSACRGTRSDIVNACEFLRHTKKIVTNQQIPSLRDL